MLVCAFKLGDLYLGIDILLVREINRSAERTPVPGSADYIGGMLNIRGRVITLFDLKARLKWPVAPLVAADNTPVAPYNVILKTHDEVARIDARRAEAHCTWTDPVGLVVDEMDDVLDIDVDAIHPPPGNLTGISSDFVQGVVQQGSRLLILLDVRHVLDTSGLSLSG
ncbi:MAG: chemotaxis protein CheW [Gammaproteobacteria bacterium]